MVTSKLSQRTDLPEEIKLTLNNFLNNIRFSPKAPELLWRRLNRDAEDRGVLLDPKYSKNLLYSWAKLYGVSLEKSAIDMRHAIYPLGSQVYEDLCDRIDEPVDQQHLNTATTKPAWDRDRRKLLFKNQVIKTVRGLAQAPNVAKVLDTFEELGWPPRIDDPLPDGPYSERVRNTVRSLNKGLTLIRFEPDGDGKGFGWDEA